MPSSGGWPPSPGSSVRARRTTHAPAGGSRSTRYHGGAEWPSALGRLSHSQLLEVVHHRDEERGEKRRRDPDRRSERDKPQLRAAAEGSGWDTGGVTLVDGVDGRVAALFGLR